MTEVTATTVPAGHRQPGGPGQKLQDAFSAGRRRGQIDADLAIAGAKIAEAEHFDEAVSYLTPRESFAVLNSRSALQRLDDLPGRAGA